MAAAGEVKKSRLFSALGNMLRHDAMRPAVRVFSALHVELYRLTGGKAQVAKYPTMLLTTKGRRTGKRRTIPVIYLQDGSCFIIAAAYAGSDTNPTWWLNLQASGEAVIQIKRQTIPVRAQLATDAEKAALWPQLVAMYPYFTGYQERTQRPIPVIFLTPTSPAPS